MTDKDFEEMRQQMDLLKEKLNRQEVVNEQLMRRTIESKLNRLNTNRRFKRIYMISNMVFIPWLLVRGLALPLWFAVVTVGMIALALVYHEAFMEHISADDLNRYSIHEINEKAVRLKQQGARWLRIGIPLIIVWLITFIYVVQHRFDLEAEGESILYGVAIGTIIGACLGFIIYRKQRRMIDYLRTDISVE
ncbi:MAG: hypothetical protein IJ209_06865 [Bacteroidaceae bacterium]|nr:hypothetical protein [Bacteroidaceae bacterium]